MLGAEAVLPKGSGDDCGARKGRLPATHSPAAPRDSASPLGVSSPEAGSALPRRLSRAPAVDGSVSHTKHGTRAHPGRVAAPTLDQSLALRRLAQRAGAAFEGAYLERLTLWQTP